MDKQGAAAAGSPAQGTGFLTGRVAVVTGAGSGLGREYARLLSARGATVYALDIDGPGAQETASLLSPNPGGAGYEVDLTNPGAVAKVFASIADRSGRIDICVNNAGGEVPGAAPFDPAAGLGALGLATWNRTFEINVTTALLCSLAAAPYMVGNRYGRIVNVSSRAARSTGWFSGVSPAYSCAKAAVLTLTRELAKELGPMGVTVNCLVPSFTISKAQLQADWEAMSEIERQDMIARTPLRRLPEPAELARVVAFLCSDESSYMNGAAVDVNGGSFMA